MVSIGLEPRKGTYLVRKNHQTPVCFTSQNTPNALSGMSHGIESQIVGFFYAMVVAQEFESGLRAGFSFDHSPTHATHL
jgi:hypothetical protein